MDAIEITIIRFQYDYNGHYFGNMRAYLEVIGGRIRGSLATNGWS